MRDWIAAAVLKRQKMKEEQIELERQELEALRCELEKRNAEDQIRREEQIRQQQPSKNPVQSSMAREEARQLEQVLDPIV